MLTKKKWTVGYVNFHTTTYLKWQLKILYEFNNPEDFELIIIDNSSPSEVEALRELVHQYTLHDNVKIIRNDLPIPDGQGSSHHALGLELILQNANANYLLIQDPDFFWVKRNYLRNFAAYLDKGDVAIGAPYRRPVGFGSPDFPTAFGCAYRLCDLEKNDFHPQTDKDRLKDTNTTYPYPEFEFSADVGWKIREKLANASFTSFEQRDASELSKLMGEHSFESSPCEYFLEGETIAFHLFRGSFPSKIEQFQKESLFSPPKKWTDVREKYAHCFYEMAKNNGKSRIFSLKRRLAGYYHKNHLQTVKEQIFYMQKYKYQQKDINCYYSFLSKKYKHIQTQITHIKKNLDINEVFLTNIEKDTHCFEEAMLFNINLWKIKQKKPLLTLKNNQTLEEKSASKLLLQLDKMILNLSYLIAEIEIRIKKSYIKKQISYIHEKTNSSEKDTLSVEHETLMQEWLTVVDSNQLLFKNPITQQTISLSEYYNSLHQLILNNNEKINLFNSSAIIANNG